MRMKCRWLLAGVIALFAVGLNSCSTGNSNGTTTGTGFVWVATQGDQMVRSYAINLSTGAAVQVGTSAATGVGPIAMALTPAGDALFIANRDDNTISAYTFKSDGSLTAAGTPVPAGETPVALAVDPGGVFLFVASQGNSVDPISGTISVFNIKSGVLTPAGAVSVTNVSLTSNVATITAANAFVPGEIVRLEGLNTATYLNNQTVAVRLATATQFTFSFTHADDPTHSDSGAVSEVFPTVPSSGTGSGPAAIAVAPVDNLLYVANQFNSTVSIFSYDTSGVLTLNPTSPVSVGANPSGLAFSRCAGTTTATTACPTTAPPTYLFVANTGSNDISIFSACIQTTATCPSPNGILTPVGAPVSAGGTHPVSFIVDPVLDFVYAVDNGSFQVSEYKYSSATGALTALSPATASTGASPLGGGITSDGNWIFIPNNGGSSVSAFGVTTSGQLSVATAISLAGQPSAILVK